MDYPTVDIEFIVESMKETGRLVEGGYIKSGRSHKFILAGKKPLHKRTVYLRDFDVEGCDSGQVNFIQATSIATVHYFMGALLQWFRDKRGWDEGAYSQKYKDILNKN